MDKRDLQIDKFIDGSKAIKITITHLPTNLRVNGYGTNKHILESKLIDKLEKMVDGEDNVSNKSEILKLEVQLLNIKKQHDDEVKAAYLEGWNDGLISPNSTEEDQQDDWLLSKSFREIATKGE